MAAVAAGKDEKAVKEAADAMRKPVIPQKTYISAGGLFVTSHNARARPGMSKLAREDYNSTEVLVSDKSCSSLSLHLNS